MLENGVVVGRIFKAQVAPQGRPWMWASGHNGDIKRAATDTSRRARRRWRRSRRAGEGITMTTCHHAHDAAHSFDDRGG